MLQPAFLVSTWAAVPYREEQRVGGWVGPPAHMSHHHSDTSCQKQGAGGGAEGEAGHEIKNINAPGAGFQFNRLTLS